MGRVLSAPSWLGLAVLLSCCVGCGESGPPAPRNVLLLSVDTLRADHLGSYGYDRPTSPFLDELALRGVRFENVVAQSSWTLPSHASMLTGMLPQRHGVTSGDKRLATDLPTLQGLLSEQGLATAAIINSRFLGDRHGLSNGFDYVDLLKEKPKAGPLVFDRALAWLDDLGGESSKDTPPFFMFLHTYHVHSDYSPGELYQELLVDPYTGDLDGTAAQLQAFRRGERTLNAEDVTHAAQLYDGEIRELDDLLERFFADLESRGLLEDTLVIVTSDHGEEFMEHGDMLHGRTMYGESLRIPLLLSGPTIPVGRTVADLAMLTDILPTVARAFDQEIPEDCDGIDLSRLWQDHNLHRWVFAGADHNNEPAGLRGMIQDDRFKLMYDGVDESYELFDLVNDPGETTDLSEQRAELAEHMLGLLKRLQDSGRSADQAAPQTDEDLKALQELGYFDVTDGDR